MQSQSPAKRKRPVPPSASHHAQSVAASNATARRMLGNAGQYSWMQSPSLPSSSARRVQPRAPRLNTSAQPAMPAASALPETPSLPPTYAPAVPPTHTPHGLPSLDTPTMPPVDAPSGPWHSAVAGASPGANASRPLQRPPEATLPTRGQFLPSPAPSEDHDKSPRIPTLPPAQSAPHNALVHPASDYSMPPPTTSVSATPRTVTNVARHSSSRSLSGELSSQPNTLAPHNLNSASPIAHLSTHHHAGPWSIFEPSVCIPILTRFMATHSLNDVDHERLGLLHDAVNQRDWWFVTLIMLLAYWTLDPGTVQNLCPQLSAHGLSLADSLLGNVAPSAELLLFMGNFPKPVPELRIHLGEAQFAEVVQDIAVTLDKMSRAWDYMVNSCRQTRTLPHVQHIDQNLGIRSSVFQRVVFRSLLRLTWGTDWGEPAEAAMHQFMADQQYYAAPWPNAGLVRENVYPNFPHQHIQSVQTPNVSHTPSWSPANATAAMFFPPAANNTSLNVHQPVTSPMNPVVPTMSNHFPAYSPYHQVPTPAQIRQAQIQAQMQMEMQRQRQTQMLQAQQQASLQARSQGTIYQPQSQFQPPPPAQQGQQQQSAPSTPSTPHSGTMLPNQPLPLVQPAQAAPNLRPAPPRNLFPRATDTISYPAQPNPTRSALHQAHLRSPNLRAKRLDGSAPPQFFRCFVGFALAPQKLTDSPTQEISFKIPATDIQNLLNLETRSKGAPPFGAYDESTITFRLKCCQISPNQSMPSESKWSLMETDWPSQLFCSLNGHALEPRRKLHHGKCLPINLTNCIKMDNTLTVRINRLSTDKSPFDYAVAVERVGFMAQGSIKEACFSRTVPAEDVLGSIKASLAGDDDDDIAIVQSNLPINLFEPFSNAKIFDIPVRGKECLHREAFDLDVFLQTRLPVHDSKQVINKVDNWRCPFCKSDCRPQSLVVDGFLMQVRQDLTSKNLLKTRTILVEEDGSWKPVQEAQDDEDSDDETQGPSAGKSTPNPTPKKNIDIITIDDD